ncbi:MULTISPECIES: AsmA-like C-terminal region-containing protein [unclassified Gluconobacter]|uniref:AsmA family protein n=1 Tax=unclassified Gluconobacter TaxID=2644261 RepID=UPI001F1B1C49|nr:MULTISPECIES: AsmA-like C-terminal region-containing protein [unclassified Gluconobacter]
MKWLLGAFLGFLVVCSAIIGGGWLWIDQKDFSALATQKLEKATGRTVKIGSLRLSPGQWITIDAKDLHLANIPGGSRPDMVSVGALHARIRLTSLLHGPLETRDVTIDHFSGLFERTPDRTPNWRFKSHKTSDTADTQPPPSDKPDLSWFPGLRNATINESDVTYRSAKGASYQVTMQHVTFQSENDASPLSMAFQGAYNGTPVTLDATMQPLKVLRRAPEPYGAKAHVTSGDLAIDFDGTLTDALNFEGVKGNITLSTPTSAPIFALAGLSDTHPVIPLTLNGTFSHAGDNWHLTNTTGNFQSTKIKSGTFDLNEGGKGKPDIISTDLNLGRVDLNDLNKALSSGKSSGPTDIPLIAPAKPDPVLHVKLTADEILYNTLTFAKLKLDASQTPGRIDVSTLALGYLGAGLQANGHMEDQGGRSRVTANIALSHGDIDRLRRTAGLAPVPVKGSLSIRIIASANNVRTLNEATRKADLVAAVSMEKGEIAREIVEAASMDLRLLFRHAKGTTPITCMLGVLEMHQGIGKVVPLRLKTSAGVLAAKADFDLNRRWLDLVFASRPFSTSFFALDIPVRVSGRFDSPDLSIAKWSKKGRDLLADSNELTVLPAALRSFASSNACARPTQ